MGTIHPFGPPYQVDAVEKSILTAPRPADPIFRSYGALQPARVTHARSTPSVCRREVVSELFERWRTIGSTIHRTETGISRLNAMASSSR